MQRVISQDDKADLPEPANHPNDSLAARIGRLVFAVLALIELGVGLAVLAFPGTVGGLLLAAPLEGVGLVVARMLGIAIFALGLTWWLANRDPYQWRKRIAPGFISYNLGVGLLFFLYALAATRVMILPWTVAVFHLLVGFASAMTVLVRPQMDETN